MHGHVRPTLRARGRASQTSPCSSDALAWEAAEAEEAAEELASAGMYYTHVLVTTRLDN
jgi:hypothetical protein